MQRVERFVLSPDIACVRRDVVHLSPCRKRSDCGEGSSRVWRTCLCLFRAVWISGVGARYSCHPSNTQRDHLYDSAKVAVMEGHTSTIEILTNLTSYLRGRRAEVARAKHHGAFSVARETCSREETGLRIIPTLWSRRWLSRSLGQARYPLTFVPPRNWRGVE